MKQLILLLWLCLCLFGELAAQQKSERGIRDSVRMKEVKVQATKPFIIQKADRVIFDLSTQLTNTGSTTAEALSNLPGLEITDTAISFRNRQGMTVYINDRQVHLDGKQLIDYLNSLPSGTIEKVEIMTVPPPRYGARGAAGIVNIRTKKATVEGLYSNISLNYGRGKYGKSVNSANMGYLNNKFSVTGIIGYSATENFFEVQRERNFYASGTPYTFDQHNHETSSTRAGTYNTALEYRIGKQTTVGTSINGSRNRYWEAGDYRINFRQNTQTDSVLKTGSTLNTSIQNNMLNAFLLHNFKEADNSITLNLDHLAYHNGSQQRLENNTFLPDETINYHYILLSNNPFAAKIYSIKADLEIDILPKTYLSTGAQHIYSVRNSEANYANQLPDNAVTDQLHSNSLRYSEHIQAAYVSLRHASKRMSVQAGLRLEDTKSLFTRTNALQAPETVKISNLNTFPTIYVTYNPDKEAKHSLAFSAMRRIGRPGYGDLNPSAFYFDRYTVSQGNPLLVPELNTYAELNYTYNSSTTFGFSIDHTKNKISSWQQLVDQAIINTRVNLKAANIFTFYSNTMLKPASWWKINLYGSAGASKYRLANNETVSLTTFSINGSQQFTLKNDWSAEITGSSRTRITYGQGLYYPLGRLHVSVQKKILKSKGALTLGARDIFYSQTIKRKMAFDGADLSLRNRNDTRVLNLTFTYRPWNTKPKPVRKTGLQTEQQRVGAN